jgi:ankyrin repeat protein
MTAAVLGRTTATETLIKAGADVSLKDKSGKTAAELASDEAIRTALSGR